VNLVSGTEKVAAQRFGAACQILLVGVEGRADRIGREGGKPLETEAAKQCRPAKGARGREGLSAEWRRGLKLSGEGKTVIRMHKFKEGQIVQFSGAAARFSHAAPGPYEITRRLPYAGGEFEYHIKSSEEAQERIAKESQLAAL
jgi:hypothetical protein